MSLPYDLHVEFEKTGEDGVLAGAVTVTVCVDCTCRKLLLWTGKSSSGGNFETLGKAQTLADWAEWRAGETYRYPFAVSAEPAGDCGVRTQVHRIGEWAPDPEEVFLAVPVTHLVPAQPTPFEAQSPPEFTPVGWQFRSTGLEGLAPVEDVALEFDRENLSFDFGDAITGFVSFTAARDLIDCRMGLDYQWRTHGQTERCSGEHHPVSVSAQSTWQARQAYRLPFRFSIPDGPRTSHGHIEKLDWYVWPVLIPLDGSEPAELLQAEAEIELTGRPEKGYVLNVDDLSPAARDHLKTSVVILMVALLLPVGVYFVASVFSLGLAVSDDRTVVSTLGTVGALIILVAGLLAGLNELINRGIAEYYLGIVGVHIAGAGKVQATVTLQPRRNVRLQAIKLALKVYEDITIRQGTRSTTKRRAIFDRIGKLRLEQRVAAGDIWSRTFALPFPPNLPGMGSRPGGTDTAIVWLATLTILQHGRPPWRQSYALKVKYAKVEASHLLFDEAKEMYQLEILKP
jgi:hypothetical protein